MQEKQGHEFNHWVGRIPGSRKWQPAPIFLPGESHEQRSLAAYSLWGCKESDSIEHTQHRIGLNRYAWQPIEYVSERRGNNFRWFWFLHLIASISKFMTEYIGNEYLKFAVCTFLFFLYFYLKINFFFFFFRNTTLVKTSFYKHC